MGRTMYDLSRESLGYNTEFIIKGFVDDDLFALSSFNGYPLILGTISEYQPLEDDVFVCSIGGRSRSNCIQMILEKGGKFISLIHKQPESAQMCSWERKPSGCFYYDCC